MVEKKLLILDIDECLVHATENKLNIQHDFEADWCYVYKRPFVDEFLAFCSNHFDVALWTSAGAIHADFIVNILFPKDYELEFVWSSSKCTRRYDELEFREYYIKNFRKLRKKGYELSRIVMVDDTPEKHIRNYGNLVSVTEFTGNPADNELQQLMKYLLVLKNCDDIRAVDKRNWKNDLTN